jgi:hypothetical protein
MNIKSLLTKPLKSSIKTWIVLGLLLLAPVLIIVFSKVIFGLLLNVAIIVVLGMMLWAGYKMITDLTEKK